MRHPAPLARGSVSKVTLEGSQSQQLPGGINFSRLSPVELLGNLRGDKNIHICRGQAEKRGLRRPGQAGEGPAFRGSRGGAGAAGALSGCPPGVWGVPAPSPPPRPAALAPGAGLPPEGSPRQPGRRQRRARGSPLLPSGRPPGPASARAGGRGAGSGAPRLPRGLPGAAPAEPPRSLFAAALSRTPRSKPQRLLMKELMEDCKTP